MRTFMQAVHQRALARSMRLGRRLARDENGVTAIEFAMVGLPFFMMLFGIMGVGFYFFTIFNLENAVEQASRPLRTGEVREWRYGDDKDPKAITFKQGDEMGRFLLGSTVVMLWPKMPDGKPLGFNSEWQAARPIRLGEAMAGSIA